MEICLNFIEQQFMFRGKNSYDSPNRIEKENLQVHTIIDKIKSPFLSKIEHAKKHFQHQIETFNKEKKQAEAQQQRNRISQQESQQASKSNQKSNKPQIQQRIFTQSQTDEIIDKPKIPFFREWAFGNNQKSMFGKAGEMFDHYNRVFQRKVKFANNPNSYKGESFKIEEKKVISEIFYQICNSGQESVYFSAICSFFNNCPLFYQIYNIHPDSLLNVVKDSAHTFQDRLTLQQFMDIFLLNNRTGLDYQNYNVQKIVKKCILDDESWKQLKQIFIVFDTFGNETIQIRQFFQKLKVNIQHNYLLQKNVLFFPSINRHYNLKKIIFELQHKLKIGQGFAKWQQIKDMIINFKHITHPTIDIIDKSNIASGKINKSSNSYMLKDQILNYLKDIFEKCPKYCRSFVKVNHFCNQVYELQSSKPYMSQVVRNQPEMINFNKALGQLKGFNIQYLDLDEIIQWFSLKGYEQDSNKTFAKKPALFQESEESEDQEISRNKRQKDKQRKHIQNLPQRYLCKTQSEKHLTKIQQFNLSKRTELTIRERRVKQMIAQKQEKEKKQYSKRIKANPIPASINNEKYQQYKQMMAKNKGIILAKLNMTSEKDQLILQYLQANTKLFQLPKNQQQKQSQQFIFQSKPVPWYVHVDLLEKINHDKTQRKKQLKKMNKQKYLKEWKNLPSFLQEICLDSDVFMDKASQQNLLKELQNNSKSKRKAGKVPNFQQLHKKFIQQLQKKKHAFQPTKIQEFQLTSPKKFKKQVSKDKQRCFKSEKKFKKQYSPSHNYIGSTIKYEQMIKLKQTKREEQQTLKQQLLKIQKQKQKNKKIFAKYMRKQLSKQISNSCIKLKQSRTNSQDRSTDKNMADMYQRVFSRPFLFQTNSSQFHNKSSEVIQSRAKPVQFSDQTQQYNEIDDLNLQQVLHNNYSQNKPKPSYQQPQLVRQCNLSF